MRTHTHGLYMFGMLYESEMIEPLPTSPAYIDVSKSNNTIYYGASRRMTAIF